ncbi:zinc knuckle CX2CX4HX4C containing protein [Tanacetum coccineum]
MPLSMYTRLGLGKLIPVNMNVELADRTKSIPKEIVENLLVKIDKFIFLVDFILLDMVEDFRMPNILGRPLLAIAHAEVDVFRKLISLAVGNAKLIFKIKDNFNETLTLVESESLKGIEYRWDTILDQGEPWDIESLDEPHSNQKHEMYPSPQFHGLGESEPWKGQQDDQGKNLEGLVKKGP